MASVAAHDRRGLPAIGALHGVAASQWVTPSAAFLNGLRDTGFVVNLNVAVEYRWAEGQFDRIPAMVADLLGRRVSVIFSSGSDVATRAAKAATQVTPIVFTTGSDPVAANLVVSLNRPDGNTTGVTTFNSELGPKKLEMFHEMIPTANKVALLVNPINPVNAAADRLAIQTAARRLGWRSPRSAQVPTRKLRLRSKRLFSSRRLRSRSELTRSS